MLVTRPITLWIILCFSLVVTDPGAGQEIQWEDKDIEYVDADRLVVALMGDPQLHMNPQSLDHARTAMADLATLEYDFLAVLGDLVQNKHEYYADYKTIISGKATRPLFSLAGNADLSCGLDKYQETTGMPLYFAMKRRGIRFIFLSVMGVTGPKTHICNLDSDQLTWLRKELAGDTKSTTVLLSHAPVYETTWRSEDREALPFPGSMYLKESVEMRRLFRKYPNIQVFAHGHLHHAYGVKDQFGRDEYAYQDGVFHISVGATANNRGSSFLLIEKDKITATVRDHSKNQWRDQFLRNINCRTSLTAAEP